MNNMISKEAIIKASQDRYRYPKDVVDHPTAERDTDLKRRGFQEGALWMQSQPVMTEKTLEQSKEYAVKFKVWCDKHESKIISSTLTEITEDELWNLFEEDLKKKGV